MTVKLVRDLIPDRLRQEGIEPTVYVAGDAEYAHALLDKLVEEAKEAHAAGANLVTLTSELIDVYEVLDAIIQVFGLSRPGLEALQKTKRDARGGFSARQMLDL